MGQFKVIKEINFGSGYIPDKSGNQIPMQNFAPKLGSIIELGELQEKTVWSSAPMKGYDYVIGYPSTSTTVFIRQDQVQPISNSQKVVDSIPQEQSQKKDLFSTKNIMIAIVAITVIVIVLKKMKFL